MSACELVGTRLSLSCLSRRPETKERRKSANVTNSSANR
jgi:hypothetical protein